MHKLGFAPEVKLRERKESPTITDAPPIIQRICFFQVRLRRRSMCTPNCGAFFI